MWLLEIFNHGGYMGNLTYERNKTKLKYTKSQVSKAGRCIRKNEGAIHESFKIIQNFRAAHLYPLMIIKNHVWKYAQKIGPKPIVARRLKRLPTIIDKLERTTLDGVNKNSIDLVRMQDIGGCRVIVHDADKLNAIDNLLDNSKTIHTTIKKHDYIKNPKDTGYRGIHRIYKCFNTSKTHHDWKGFLIEVQIRTRLQHIWATTVEIIDVFENNVLKTNPFNSNKDWIRFFKIMSDFFADEEKFLKLNIDTKKTLQKELINLNNKLKVTDKLQSWNAAFSIKKIEEKAYESKLIILNIDHLKRNVSVEFFKKNNDAIERYNYLEVNESERNIVLVEMDDIRNIKKAYPNYLIDTDEFISKFVDYTGAYYWSK